MLAAGDGGISHFQKAVTNVSGKKDLPSLAAHGKTDWQIIREILEEAQLDLELALLVAKGLDRISNVYLTTARATLLPSVNEVLGQLKARGVKNGLLTGNSELRSRRKLEGGGVDTALIDWSAGFFGVRSPVRSALTASARQAHPHKKLLIIGDTPFDGLAAKAAGIPFLAVCTGKYDRTAFTDSDAIAVIDTLADGYETILAVMQDELAS